MRDNMSKKHYEKIMSRRQKRSQKVADMLEKLDLEDQSTGPFYMNTDGTIDWNKLAKHVREATSGR